ncbi:MAG TPA: single-stranded DNA-binding protein [Paenibacillaceae bacterium]|nr:single-stranded DNA-binding protein [Paenibacillaceae bacterium]
MINRAVLLGRLTKDPELRYTSSGIAVATFTLAIDRRTSNQQGERETDFIPIVAWRQLGELVAQYLKKGQQAAVEGKIQVRNYENKEGRKVYVTEIVADNVQFLGGGNGGNGNSNRSNQGGISKENNPFGSNQGNSFAGNPFGGNPFAGSQQPIDISDDELPF